jgi:hypothetical protein
MKTKTIFKIITWICVALISVGYFLWIYNHIGFQMTGKHFFIYGFCLAGYTVCLYLFCLLLEFDA